VEDAAIIEQQSWKNVFQIIFRTIETFYKKKKNKRRISPVENRVCKTEIGLQLAATHISRRGHNGEGASS